MDEGASALKMGGTRGVLMFAAFFTLYTYFITLKCQSGKWDLLNVSFPESVEGLLPNQRCIITILGWFLVQCALYVSCLGGSKELGVRLANGNQLSYNTNALFVFGINIIQLMLAIFFGNDVSHITGSLFPILTTCVLLCFVFSWYLYFRGLYSNPEDRNIHGWSGFIIYDWFMGRELNPRWRSLDVKYVLFRSCIIGWILLNILNFAEYLYVYKSVNWTLLLLNVTQLTYVADYFWFERGVIVSRDIVSEGLGYNILIQFIMIPFCFSVQTRYILTTRLELSPVYLSCVLVLYASGYIVYRASNSQKNDFRKDPESPKFKHLKTMATTSGRKLLISGWWGMCRHPNYLGDILISLSYSLCCGFHHVIPYLGSVFLVLLLLDRARQDGDDCKRKYGADWDKYCSIVKYKIVPGIY